MIRPQPLPQTARMENHRFPNRESSPGQAPIDACGFSGLRGLLLVNALFLVFFLGITGSAQASKPKNGRVVVIPVGKNIGFDVTTHIAQALVEALNRERDHGRPRAELHYFTPVEKSAPVDLEDAIQEFRNAKIALENLDLNTARRHAKKALSIRQEEIEGGGNLGRYVDILHLIAAIELFDGRDDTAKRAMEDAAAIEARRPSADRYNPSVRKLYNRVVSTRKKGTLRFEVEPDALIWINRKIIGLGEETIQLKPGRYWVRIFRPGFAPWVEWVRVERGRSVVISTQMTPLPTHEAKIIVALRQSVESESPGMDLSRATKISRAAEVILVAASKTCALSYCPVTIAWGHNNKWRMKSDDRYTGNNAMQIAKRAIGSVNSTEAIANSQNPNNPAVRANGSVAPNSSARTTPIYRKWWFWTALGAGSAAIAGAILVPALQ